MSVVINIVLILASLVLIVAVLMQEGSKQGLGTIGGMAETFFGKNEAKSAEGKLLNITRIVAAIFVVLALVATWLNARTYTVTYYDENGNEYFTEIANEVAMNNLYVQAGMAEGSIVDYDDVYAAYKSQAETAGMSDEELAKSLRVSYKKGAEVPAYSTPYKEGYNGVWVLGEKTEDGVKKIEGEVPATMGRKGLTLIPEYTIGTYTVKIIDNGIPAEGEEAAAEDNVIFEQTAEFDTAIDYAGIELPEVDEYFVFYSTDKDAVANGNIFGLELPETMPGADTTLYVCYAHGNFIEYYSTNEEGEDIELFPTFFKQVESEVLNMAVEAALSGSEIAEEDLLSMETEMYNTYIDAYKEAGMENNLRQFVTYGEALEVEPAPEGYEWDIELPEVGDGVRYQLHAVAIEETEEAVEETAEEVTEEVTEEAPATEAE